MTAMLDDVFAELSDELGASSVGDPYSIFAERRKTTPVMVGDIMGEFGLPSWAQSIDGSRPVFTLFRYDDIVAVLRDPDRFSSSVILDTFMPVLGRVVLGMDGAEHRSFRGLLMPAFTRRLLDIWQSEIVRPVALGQAGEVARTDGKRADLMGFALRFPVRMIYEILGFPDDEEAYGRFARSGLTMLLALNGVNPSDPEETERAVARAIHESEALYTTVLEVVERRRAEGSQGDDFIGHLLRAEFEGARLDDDQITVFVRSLLLAAAETTTRNWLNVLTCLLERPAVLDEVRENRELIPAAIAEGMRLESAATMVGRVATRDVELRGVEIPAGAGVTLALASGNRDEDAFPDPDVFDLHRNGKPGLGFGFGPHLCPGMNTAKIEMLEAISAILDSLPNVRFDPDAQRPVVRGVAMRSPAGLPVVWD